MSGGAAVTRSAGERVGPYTLVDPIGRGGFSEVWRAVAADGREVALKLLIHSEHLAQLRREASALALVRGEGIVPILGMSLDDDPPWIALELLGGGDLRRRMRGGALPATQAIVVFETILDVLARVHREGIVHGDLKPENVLFTTADAVFLADFGLSRQITQRSASLSVSLSLDDARLAGTLDYMAPEQRSGEKPTTRSDVFAAGVLLYELLTGERPQGVFKMPSEIDPSLPPVVDRLIACSLAQDPRHRFASAKPMLAFLRAGLTTDWADLATAQKRLERLVRLSAAGQAHGSDTTLKAVVIALGTLSLILGSAGAFAKDYGFTRFVAGCAAGVLAVGVAARLTRPWLSRRYETICDLKTKVELQIRTGGEWSKAVASSARSRPRIVVRRATGRPRTSEVWPPPPRPPAGVAPACGGTAAIFLLGLIAIRACVGGSRAHTSAPYSPSPPYQPVPSLPFLPAPPAPPAFDDTRYYGGRTSVVATWTLDAGAGSPVGVAAMGTRVFVATKRGVVHRFGADAERTIFTQQRDVEHFAVGGGRVATSARDGSIAVFDEEDGSRVRAITEEMSEHTLRPTRLALSPDGLRLAYAVFGSVTVVDLETGRRRPLTTITGSINALGFDVAGCVLATSTTGMLVRSRTAPGLLGESSTGVYGASSAPSVAALSRSGSWIASQDAAGALEVVVSSGDGFALPRRAPVGVRLAVSDDGNRVLVLERGGRLSLFQGSVGTCARLELAGVIDVAFAAGAKFVTLDRRGGVTLHEIVR